jgi:hypothetical protein
MSELKLNLYSKYVLGSSLDPTTASKKTSLLVRLGICDPVNRSISLDDIKTILVLFRVVHFTSADLLVCRNFSIDEITKYRNPCNLRNAYLSAINACNDAGLSESVKELEAKLASSFRGGLSPPEGVFRVPTSPVFSAAEPILRNLEVVAGDHGYSLISKSEFKRGDYVITLADDIPISVFSAIRHKTFPGADLAEQGLHPDTILLLFLIYLRDQKDSLSNAMHRDFFCNQPSNFGTLYELPLEVVEALDEPDLVQTVLSGRKQLLEICNTLIPSPSFEDLLWAKSLCTSRAFSLKIMATSDLEEKLFDKYYPSRHVTTILPIVHLINHDFAAQLETPIVCPGGCIALRALVNIDPGSELFLNYGGFTNKELLLNYGFFVENNPYDTFEVGGSIFRRGAIQSREVEQQIPLHNVPEEYAALVSGYLADRASFRSTCSH